MLLNVFVNGLSDNTIRQCLLEMTDISFDKAYDQEHSLKLAKRNCEKFDSSFVNAAVSGNLDRKTH